MNVLLDIYFIFIHLSFSIYLFVCVFEYEMLIILLFTNNYFKCCMMQDLFQIDFLIVIKIKKLYTGCFI